MQDQRFTRRLYTVAKAARLVGMYSSTLATWAHGYERRPVGRAVVKEGPVITALERAPGDGRSIPFIGLVEATKRSWLSAAQPAPLQGLAARVRRPVARPLRIR